MTKRSGLSNGYISNVVEPSKYPIPQGSPYTCPELNRQCMRPGAYDAFDKPSVDAGGNRRPYWRAP